MTPTEMPRWGKIGKQKIEDEGPLPPHPMDGIKYNMETVDGDIRAFPSPSWTRPRRTASRSSSGSIRPACTLSRTSRAEIRGAQNELGQRLEH
jgi:hypothetical protein